MKKGWRHLIAGSVLSVSLAGSAIADTGKITVFAAASLTNALQDIATVYQKEHKVAIASSFASSSTLARQIEAGAPADLFISADQKWMNYAVEKETIQADTRKNLLENTLVLVAPKSSAQGDVTNHSATKSVITDGLVVSVTCDLLLKCDVTVCKGYSKIGGGEQMARKMLFEKPGIKSDE